MSNGRLKGRVAAVERADAVAALPRIARHPLESPYPKPKEELERLGLMPIWEKSMQRERLTPEEWVALFGGREA